MVSRITGSVSGLLVMLVCLCANAGDLPHNLVLFVPDGLRAQMVSPETAPAMARLRDAGVTFANSHSLYPSLTTANASAFATGHSLGDTGNYANTLFAGFSVPSANKSVTPFLEDDTVLGDMDQHFAGDYLNAETILAAARKAGYNTAAIGKLGPVLIFDHTERSGQLSVIVDDNTGKPNGIAIPEWVRAGLERSHLSASAPARGNNGLPGDAVTPGTRVPNSDQQQWMVAVLNRVILKKFRSDSKPFVIVFWSRDPDGTQHNQGDSLNQLEPGINGPTSLAAIKNVDGNLQQIRDALAASGLESSTNIIVSSDHGFSTISKQSVTSPSVKEHYADVPEGFLPPGFLAKDLSHLLGLPLWDPDQDNSEVKQRAHSSRANGLVGSDPDKPALIVTANGGTDLIYLPDGRPGAESGQLTARIVQFLLAQDYVSGIFVDDRLGRFPGTLTLNDINLQGSARTPTPSILVNFTSLPTGCAQPALCAAEIADTVLQQGQGMHGSFSRADTFNFTAAYGPDFKKRFMDYTPVSNADIGKTMAKLLKLPMPDRGKLAGRVIDEALLNGATPEVVRMTLVSDPACNGLQTRLDLQQVGTVRYLDAAGFDGRTVGLGPQKNVTSGVDIK